MRFVQTDDVRAWLEGADTLSEYTRGIGRREPGRDDGDFAERVLGFPLHLRHVIEKTVEEGGAVASDAFDSIPFYSLCRGLFLPLSGMAPEKTATVFGLVTDPAPDAAAREALLARFLEKQVGLTLVQKLGCVLGDPFQGRPSYFRRDGVLRLLMSVTLASRRELLDRLTQVGDVAVLFAERRPRLREEPPLTAAEVLETLRLLPDARGTRRLAIARSLLLRCGKLEAFFLARLLLRRAGFGFEYQGPLLARALASSFGAPEEQVAHAMALTDAFHVAGVLTREGSDGLRRIQLQPLVPVRPALASGTVDEIARFPVWVERKYDGIRLMLHKSTDARGSVLCGAYTRNRQDWLEQVAGLDATIKRVPARSVILDGELYGTILDLDGARPASVYDVYAFLQGERAQPVTLRYAAFDLVYLDGRDCTGLPLSERRRLLSLLLAPLAGLPTPVAMTVSEGQLASHKNDVNRLFHHFRAQGYEGVITKDLEGTYRLAERDPSWLKRKPEITLDLVLLGAVFAVTAKENAGVFGSYVIGARRPDGGFEDVGDVAGVDRLRDADIQQEIMRQGLMTGRRIERPSASGVRPGVELRPHIVVTVKLEGIARDLATGKLSLRDPKIAVVRADKGPAEADLVAALAEIHLRARVG